MKKVSFIILIWALAVALLAACSNPEQKRIKQAELDVQSYLDEEMPGAKVTEIVKVDSAYSAFNTLLSYRLKSVEFYSQLVKRYDEMYTASSRGVFNKKKADALQYINENDDHGLELLNSIIEDMSDPFAKDKTMNRIGVYAKYTLDDGTETDTHFFYENSEAKIGHSSNMLFDTLSEIFDSIENIRSIKREIEDCRF